MSEDVQGEQRRSERVASRKCVELIIDADLIGGESINVSSTGVSITTEAPIEVELRFGQDPPFRAALVWAHRQSDGHCQYGFEYSKD